MRQYEYKLKGSTGVVHTLRLIEKDGEVSFKCSCRGSTNKHVLCKHRLALLMGDLTDLVDINSWDSQNFIDVISLLNVNKQLDNFIKLVGYRNAYLNLIDLSRKIDASEEPQNINIITIDDYEKLLNANHFTIVSETIGVSEHLFSLNGIYVGSIKTRRGVSKIKDLAKISFRSEKYLTERYEHDGNDFVPTQVMGFHHIKIVLSKNNPAYHGETVLDIFRYEAKKIAKLFSAI